MRGKVTRGRQTLASDIVLALFFGSVWMRDRKPEDRVMERFCGPVNVPPREEAGDG